MWLANAALALGAATSVSARALDPLDKRQAAAAPFNNDYSGPRWTSPPSYPSPWGSGSGNWSSAYEKATAFVSQLTLLEKVNLTTGVGWSGERCVGNVGEIPRLGFHSLCMQDSPLGVRFADYVSGFPAGVNVAATWNRDLAYARGVAMGEEHRNKGVDVQLGPVCGPLGRHPEGGRNWEGFSPDPYLTGQLIAPTIQGIQSAGVMACTKHYIVNEQEHFRSVGAPYNITDTLSSNLDDKTMHELYLWPFADAVKAGTASVMCSYNQINNSYGCGNSYTLNHLLKNELGFQGFVMSDWQAQHSGLGTAFAGLDMTMPGDTEFNTGLSFWGTNLTVAVLNGTMPEWRLDDMATRIMAGYYYVGRDQNLVPTNFYSWGGSYKTNDLCHFNDPSFGVCLVSEHVDVRDEHALVIRQVGQQSNVLLKNTGSLPLGNKIKSIGIFGMDAGSNPDGANGCSDRGCDNGTLAMGWGSGTANFPYLVTPEEAIQNYALTQLSPPPIIETITQEEADGQLTRLATLSEVSLVFVNADSGEGYISVDGNVGDRNNLSTWNEGDRMIGNVSTYCSNTIVVIHSVGPVNVSAWYDNENVTGIIWAGLPGQESGNAIVDVLWGMINPGGKLPFTIARDRTDYGTDVLYEPNNGQFGAPQEYFGEGVFLEYRYLDQNNIDPIYEFGFGLSYTTFEYSDLVITPGNPAPYVPSSGQTGPAPVLGTSSTDASQYVFPNGTIARVYEYIYPYLNTTDLKAAADDPYYGESDSQYLPAGFNDGSPQPILPAGGAPGGNPGLWEIVATVSCTIANTGSVDGDEVAQVYVGLGDGEPPKVLRGFERLNIPAGGSTTFSADLTRKDVSVWDTASQDWIQVSSVVIYVGTSSRKTPLQGTFSSSSSSGGSPSGSPTSAPTGVVSQISDGQPQAPTGVVSQISDGQPQAPTGVVSQISDGQPQAPKSAAPVSQISDGQPQAPTAAPVSQISDGQPQAATGAPVSQISDGQPQAPKSAAPVSQISDGQPQAPTAAPVSQISDGQPQAATGAPVSQISDGQPQATKTA